ncbi:Cuticle protein 7, partial [Gryllus bimaculatus]
MAPWARAMAHCPRGIRAAARRPRLRQQTLVPALGAIFVPLQGGGVSQTLLPLLAVVAAGAAQCSAPRQAGPSPSAQDQGQGQGQGQGLGSAAARFLTDENPLGAPLPSLTASGAPGAAFAPFGPYAPTVALGSAAPSYTPYPAYQRSKKIGLNQTKQTGLKVLEMRNNVFIHTSVYLDTDTAIWVPLSRHVGAQGYTHALAAPAQPVYALRTQFHAQDELGQGIYGHVEPFQAHAALQDASGSKVGSFSYVGPDGRVVRTDY